jgi:hypothetical protein
LDQVVLTQPSRMQLVNDGRYVLSGGGGALGLATWLQRLVLRGPEMAIFHGILGEKLMEK